MASARGGVVGKYEDTLSFWLAVRDWCYRQIAKYAIAVPFVVELDVPDSTVRVRDADPGRGLFTLARASDFCNQFAREFDGERGGDYPNGMGYNVCLAHRAPILATVPMDAAANAASVSWSSANMRVGTKARASDSRAMLAFESVGPLTGHQREALDEYVHGSASYIHHMFPYASPYWGVAEEDANSRRYLYSIAASFVSSVRTLAREVSNLGPSVACEDMRGGVGMLAERMLTPDERVAIFSILLKGLPVPFHVEERPRGVIVLPLDPRDARDAAQEDTWGY